MNQQRPLAFSGAAILVMVLGGLIGWFDIPSSTGVAIHFGLDGRADRFAAPWFAFSILPFATVVATAIFAIAPRLERRRDNLDRSRTVYAAFWIGVVALLALGQAVIVLNAMGVRLDVARGFGAALGAFLVVTGNIIPRTLPNSVLGVRTPWTLADDRVWARTHRLYGWLSVLLGLVLVALALFDAPAQAIGLTLTVGIVAMSLFSITYSYVIRRQPDGGRAG